MVVARTVQVPQPDEDALRSEEFEEFELTEVRQDGIFLL
jgi:hypothetical protein